MPQAQRPSMEVLNDYFIFELFHSLRTAKAIVDWVNTTLEDLMAQMIKGGKSLHGRVAPRKPTKHVNKKHTPSSKNHNHHIETMVASLDDIPNKDNSEELEANKK